MLTGLYYTSQGALIRLREVLEEEALDIELAANLEDLTDKHKDEFQNKADVDEKQIQLLANDLLLQFSIN